MHPPFPFWPSRTGRTGETRFAAACKLWHSATCPVSYVPRSTRENDLQPSAMRSPCASWAASTQISFAGGVMPQKSTDFYPKLLSGLTIYKLD